MLKNRYLLLAIASLSLLSAMAGFLLIIFTEGSNRRITELSEELKQARQGFLDREQTSDRRIAALEDQLNEVRKGEQGQRLKLGGQLESSIQDVKNELKKLQTDFQEQSGELRTLKGIKWLWDKGAEPWLAEHKKLEEDINKEMKNLTVLTSRVTSLEEWKKLTEMKTKDVPAKKDKTTLK